MSEYIFVIEKWPVTSGKVHISKFKLNIHVHCDYFNSHSILNTTIFFFSQQWILDKQDLIRERQHDLGILQEDEYQKIFIFFSSGKF